MQASWVILLLTLPGIHCYDYSVGGLAAAVSAGILLLIPIIAMLMVIFLWRDWYMKRQALKGRFRVPRKYWTMFKSKSSPTLVSTPRSERKTEFIRMYDIQGNPESRSNTIPTPRTEVIHQSNGIAQFSRKPTSAAYEEKVKTIVIEPEEEPVIMTEVLPDDHIQRPGHVTHVALEQSQPYYTHPEATHTDMQPTVIHFGQGESREIFRTTQQPDAYNFNTKYVESSMEPSNLRTTVVRLDHEASGNVLRSSQKVETYHVKTQLAGSRKPEGNDIFITPMVPAADGPNDDVTVIRSSTRQATTGSNAAVMTFPDSDEEAGMIPNTGATSNSDVLF